MFCVCLTFSPRRLRHSWCAMITTMTRHSGLIGTPRLPSAAGPVTTCVCCCFYRVPCATVMNGNAESSGTSCSLLMVENCSVFVIVWKEFCHSERLIKHKSNQIVILNVKMADAENDVENDWHEVQKSDGEQSELENRSSDRSDNGRLVSE